MSESRGGLEAVLGSNEIVSLVKHTLESNIIKAVFESTRLIRPHNSQTEMDRSVRNLYEEISDRLHFFGFSVYDKHLSAKDLDDMFTRLKATFDKRYLHGWRSHTDAIIGAAYSAAMSVSDEVEFDSEFLRAGNKDTLYYSTLTLPEGKRITTKKSQETVCSVLSSQDVAYSSLSVNQQGAVGDKK